MYFSKLLLKDFGKFHNKEINLEPGVNVVYGARNAGKSTVADFEYAMLYGIGAFPETEKDDLIHRKPHDRRGFSGKAYVKKEENEYLVERSFSKHNTTTQVLDVKSGRVGKLAHKNSLYQSLTGMDKKTYSDALYIRQEKAHEGQAEELNTYVTNLATTGASNLDKRLALSTLREQKNALDVSEAEQHIAQIHEELKQYDGDEEALEQVRKQIAENDEAFAMETAKRKREARRLIDTEKGTKYEENEELAEDLDNLRESSVFLNADLLKDYKKKLTDRMWFILLTGLFVVAVIAALVYILPFDNGVRQLFVVCTILFVIMTIIDGMRAKGWLDGENQAPSEEEFKRIVYELERKNEAYEDVEIDMSFARKFLDVKEDLQATEVEILERKKQKEQLENELRVWEERKKSIEREIYAVTLAINTIQEISGNFVEKWNYIINDHMADIMQRVTCGKYEDAKIDNRLRLVVKVNGAFRDITQIPEDDFSLVRLAVRIGIAKRLCSENMPVIVDGLPRVKGEQLQAIFTCLEEIPAEQVLVLTDDKTIVSEIENSNFTYALTNLS
ncbi:MAG: ATP-binding protein [Wujia sp.]